MEHRRAVTAEQAGVVAEMGLQAAGVQVEQPGVVRQPGVQHRVEVHRPAVVVVELASVAVGVPPVPEIPLLDALQAAVDRGARRLGLVADLLEEAADRHREQLPVAGPGFGRQRVTEPCGGPLPHAVVQPVPQQGPGQPQRERDRGGLDERLAAVLDPGPDAGRSGGQPPRVPLQDLLVTAEAREQQRTGVALQAVGESARAARAVAGEVVQGLVVGGVRGDRGEQGIGGRLPMGAGAAGVRTERAVLGGFDGHLTGFLSGPGRASRAPDVRRVAGVDTWSAPVPVGTPQGLIPPSPGPSAPDAGRGVRRGPGPRTPWPRGPRCGCCPASRCRGRPPWSPRRPATRRGPWSSP